MTEEDRRNERLKLAATWMNTLATGIITVGTFIPSAQFVFGILPQGLDSGLIYGSGFGCVGAGILLHLIGQWILGHLE